MQPNRRQSFEKWRPPRSDWRSSPLSPNFDDLRQRWHRHHGRLGRRYETRTPEGSSVAEDLRPWERGYRRNLWVWASKRAGPRGRLANRPITVNNFRPPAGQETCADDAAIDVEGFPKRLLPPQLPEDGAGSSSDGAPGASESPVTEEQDTHPRYTAAQKGKQREGESAPSSGTEPPAVEPAVSNNPESPTPKMSTQGLKIPPRHHSSVDENDKATPSVKHVGNSELSSSEKTRIVAKIHEDLKKIVAGQRLAQARILANMIEAGQLLAQARTYMGYAAELPLDGLGVIRDRTAPSQARVPDPNSQEYFNMVAESNWRLGSDTPMPHLEEEVEDEQPPSQRLPPPQSGEHSGGDVSQLRKLRPLAPRPPELRAKRRADEMSGGDKLSPFRHRHAPSPASSSTAVVIMPMNGQDRRISWNEVRAMALQPPPSVQKELYKLYSVLVHIVLAAPVDFSVVSPHDFIEALSWSNSVGGNEARVIRRLREQTISPEGVLKKLLVPFSFNAEVVFLGVVDLGGPVIRIFDQRTQEDLRKGVRGDGSDVWRFINTLVPDQCPPMTAWTITIEKTVQGPVSMSDLGDDEAPEVNKFERDVELRSVLPFFFEALRVVTGFMGRKKVDDDALLTRLFVTFEGSSHLRNPEVMRRLLADSQRFLHRSLEGRVRAVLNAGDKDVRKVARKMTCKKTRWRTRWTPPQFLLLKYQWRKRATDAVMESRNASGGLLEQYAAIRTVLEWMTMKCMFTKSLLHHDLTMRMAEEYYHLPEFRSRVWQREAVLIRFRSDGLNALAQKLQKMRNVLDRWHAMLSDHLDSSKMK